MDLIRNINSIQMFAAVHDARSLTVAAQRLRISQSSLSYHIRKLEEDLDVALFERTSSGLEPTETGAMLAVYVDNGLATIRRGLGMIARNRASVRLALLPMFSARWMASRLAVLMEQNPDIVLTIHTHPNEYAKMANPMELADLGIQWGPGQWDRFNVTRLWPERLAVVCSPAYLAEHPINTPQDLAQCSLIHVDDSGMWKEWFMRNGLEMSTSDHHTVLEDRHFQLSSTINGLGVSLFADWLIVDEIASGKLVSPFPYSFDTAYAYHLVHPQNAQLPPDVRLVHDSIVAMARADKS